MIGVPYGKVELRDGQWGKVCPVCEAFIVTTEQKDFESFSGREYADHYRDEHTRTITLPLTDWEDITGGLWRAAADAEHAADLPDYEPDEQAALRQDAVDYRRIGAIIEAATGGAK